MKKQFYKTIQALFLVMVLLVSILPVSNAYCIDAAKEDTTAVSEPTEIPGGESDVNVSEAPDIGSEPGVTDGEILPEHETDEQAANENASVYDLQPTTMENVQAAIDAYEAEYQAVLAAEGFLGALEVLKPHWQYEVAAELMPEGYNCQLVDWDETFGAEYYTFFSNPVAAANSYNVSYRVAPTPTEDIDITNLFEFIQYAGTDANHSNIAVISDDRSQNIFGAMWAKKKLDLTLPFETEMSLYLARSTAGSTATTNLGDGMTFTLHNDTRGMTAIGSDGEGLGVFGSSYYDNYPNAKSVDVIANALAIEFDLYLNAHNNDSAHYMDDPAVGHCAAIRPTAPLAQIRIGTADHNYVDSNNNTVSYFTFTRRAAWIPFKATWTPSISSDGTVGGTLTYTFDGRPRSLYISDVITFFGGTEVYWGFTGSTGGYTSVLAAAITKLPSPQYSMDVVKSVKNSDKKEIDGKYAYAGDTLTYTIRVTGSMTDDGNRIGPISIEDKLSEYVEYVDGDVTVTMSDGSQSFPVTPNVDEEILTVNTGCYLEDSGDWLEITFKVKVKEDTDAGTVVENTATAEAGNLEGSVESNTTRVTIADTSRKTVASDSAAGVDGAAVTVGEEITYEIFYFNSSESTANLTITDALTAGVEYQEHTDTEKHTGDGGNYGTSAHTITWQISGVGAGEYGSVTVTVKVKFDIDLRAIDNTLVNTAKLIWSADPSAPEEPSAENPVAGYKVTYVGNGGFTAQDDVVYVEGLFPIGDDYTVLGNDAVGFTRSGYTFLGWNTARDGLGDDHDPGDIFSAVTSDITLYAQWGKDLVFRKIDAESVRNESITALTGARFELYKCSHVHDATCGGLADPSACRHTHPSLEETDTCWAYTASYAADDGSIVTFSGLTDDTYLLMETTAPDGYRLPKGQWIVEVENGLITFISTSGDSDIPAVVAKANFYGKESDSSVEFWIGNIKQYELPVAGHVGIFWLTVLGGALIIGGVLLMLRYRGLNNKNSLKQDNNQTDKNIFYREVRRGQ